MNAVDRGFPLAAAAGDQNMPVEIEPPDQNFNKDGGRSTAIVRAAEITPAEEYRPSHSMAG